MLVLSRKIGERIVLNADITVEVLEIRGVHVRLGINAPKHVPIFRDEIPVDLRVPPSSIGARSA